jgi:chromosome segregation ATPase
VNYAESLPQETHAEVVRLTEELQMRDNLVQQLSQELFRLVKGNANYLPSPQVNDRHLAEVRALREQLHGVEQQVSFYQDQIGDRDAEIYQLRHTVTELTDRARMLEQVVQEIPNVYRQKFEERLSPIKEKLTALQKENRQLNAELQSVSYRLAVRSRRTSDLDLPSFGRSAAPALPSFGNA